MNTRTAPRTPNDWGWQFEASRYLPYVARYSRGQVASAWGGGVGGIFSREGGLKLGTLVEPGVAEILPEAGVYRRHFECAAFRIREDGIRNAGARATSLHVEAEVDASDGAWVGGWVPRPKSSPRRPCRPRRATWTKRVRRDFFRERPRHVTFQKNFDRSKLRCCNWVAFGYWTL